MHLNINKAKLICKGNMRRSLFLSTMSTFLFAFNCDKDMHTFRAKAIQSRLHPDFRLLNNPSVDDFSCTSSIKDDQDRGTIYNHVIQQQVVDVTPSKMPAAVVAVTDGLKAYAETSSISIQTDDLLEEADCDGHKDESADYEWDNSSDTGIGTYLSEDEDSLDEDFLFDALPVHGPSDWFSKSSYHDEHYQTQPYRFPEKVNDALERSLNNLLLPNIPPEETTDLSWDTDQNRAVK